MDKQRQGAADKGKLLWEDDFLKLEKLNAEIDVLIDDEKYEDVRKGVLGTGDHTLGTAIDGCFSVHASDRYHTHDKDAQWREILDRDQHDLPITNIGETDIGKFPKAVGRAWAHLFHAKLLRSEIMKRGSSDCCIRRLDDVASYLERHIPYVTQKERGAIEKAVLRKHEQFLTRLTLAYLMELSAAAQDWESMGFSERARRLIKDAEYSLDKSCEDDKAKNELYEAKAPYEFYELWARYNIGVAYFHRRYYRKAVLEFNRIIWQVKKWNEKKDKDDESKTYSNFFGTFNADDGEGEKKECLGEQLLFLPAKLYRAEVQLKIQLAYHALKTLNRHEEEEKEVNDNECGGWKSEHNQIRAEIIRTQAYQQLGRLDESWESLREMSKLLSGNGIDLKSRWDREFPIDTTKKRYPGLGERFIDILIEEHLQWLRLEGRDKNDSGEDLRHLVRHRKDRDFRKRFCARKRSADQLKKWESYLTELQKAFVAYWDQIQYNGENRSGYFQQVAKYLAWLAEAADTVKDCEGESIRNLKGHINGIAKELYHGELDGGIELRKFILEEETGLSNDKDEEQEQNLKNCA